MGESFRIEEARNLGKFRHKLAQELHPLAADGKVPGDEAGDVPAGMTETLSKAESDWIDELCKNNRDRRRYLANRERRWQTLSVNHVWRKRDHLSRSRVRFG